MTDNPKPRVGSAVLVEQNGKYLLAKRAKKNANNLWVIPGGGVDFGESIEEAAVHEIREETGLEIKLQHFIGVLEIINTKDDYHGIVFYHLAQVTGGTLVAGDDSSEAGFFSLDEIKELPKVESVERVLDRLGLVKKSSQLFTTKGTFY